MTWRERWENLRPRSTASVLWANCQQGESETRSGSRPTIWLGCFSGNVTDARHPSLIRENPGRENGGDEDGGTLTRHRPALRRGDRGVSAAPLLTERTELSERQRVVDRGKSCPVVTPHDIKRAVGDGAAGVVDRRSGHQWSLGPDKSGWIIDSRMSRRSRNGAIFSRYIDPRPVGGDGWVENCSRDERSRKPSISNGVIDPVVIHIPVPAQHVEGPIRKHGTLNPPQVLGHVGKSCRVGVRTRVIHPNCIRCVEESRTLEPANHPDDGAIGSHRGTKAKVGHVRAPEPGIVSLVINPGRV